MAEDVYAAFIDRLIAERQRRAIPSGVLAKLIGVPAATLSGWERQRSRPRGDSLWQWARALQMRVPPGVYGAPVVQHGTDSGYQTHIAAGHKGAQICTPCRDAHADAKTAKAIAAREYGMVRMGRPRR
jgi:transcriptional regulator with XRE-family HTH domain